MNKANKSIRIRYHLLGINQGDLDESLLNHDLQCFSHRIEIMSATIVLSYRRQLAPPFSVDVDLEVPGPDIHAAARDHTLQAVLHKVIDRLEKQIDLRKKRRGQWSKTRRPIRSVPCQRT